MLFALICTDKPNHLHVRQETRADHLGFLDALGDALKAAGPLTDDEGTPNGSLIIIDAPSRTEAEAIAARDPYAEAGLFESVDIRPWKWLIKAPSDVL
ncbi:MAG: YciI family protein [Devosiaceae bacterium]|nr:YciI family protein [Devosiaceae bacterium MH13]